MTQFKFEFEKTYKEIDIAGDTHRVNFDDDALNKYQKELKRFDKESKELEAAIPDYEKATDEEIDTVMFKQKELTKHVVEVFLGEGTFDGLYEKAGRSVMNLMGLVSYLIGIYTEESQKKTEEARNKYLSNVKK